jgi:replicative DNA helicase
MSEININSPETHDIDTAFVPPHHIDAENAVLGGLIISPADIDQVAEILTEADFYIRRNGMIFRAMLKLRSNSEPLDYLTLSAELEKQDQLAEIGGQAYLIGLANSTPTVLNITAYARIVAEMVVRRKMLIAASNTARLAHGLQMNVDDGLDQAQAELLAISEKRASRAAVHIGRAASVLYDQVVERSRGITDLSVPTDLVDLDNLLGGLNRSDLIVVGARPGVGKTTLLTTIASNVARSGKTAAIFSLEMTVEQLTLRLVAPNAGIPTDRLRSGKLQDDEWDPLTRAIETVAGLPIIIDDTPAITPNQVRSRCRQLRFEYGLDLVIIDYLQLMNSGGNGFENRVQEVGTISRQLKLLARDLHVPVLAAAQLSRAVEQRADKRPMLSDLRESGSIEQDADVVLLMHRNEEETDPGQTELVVAKHRHGPTGRIDLRFNPSLSYFENNQRG